MTADVATSTGDASCCVWCRGPIPEGKRRDAKTCKKACRQAHHRFVVATVAPAGVTPRGATDRPLRLAYADPPYPGLARRYYDCDEVDHVELVARLMRDYPDGWALSTSSNALQSVLAMCPKGVHVAGWFKGARSAKARKPLQSWEPLIVYGGRVRREVVDERRWDALLARGRPRSHPGRIIGMKPPAFSAWMFEQLGAEPGDTLDDLFPGSGAVARAWDVFVSRAAAATRRGRPRNASARSVTTPSRRAGVTRPVAHAGGTRRGGPPRQLDLLTEVPR